MNILPVYKEAYNCKKRYLVLRGGAGSGKSYFVVQKILIRILSETGHRFLVVKKIANSMRDTVWKEFTSMITREGLDNEFDINKSNFTITCLRNRNEIIFKGIDDSEKIKSIAGISGVFVEEATDLLLSDWEELQRRVRSKFDNYVQFILAFNPIRATHWLKAEFFDKPDEDVYTLVTTFKDNPQLSEEAIKYYNVKMRRSPNAWKIYGEGNWGEDLKGGELFHKFNYERHVNDNVKYNSALPLFISYDFNVLPSCTIVIAQIENKVINIIDEIVLEHPFNQTADVSQEFANRYQNHKAGLFVSGDPSGRNETNRNTRVAPKLNSEQDYNDYQIIMKELISFHPQLRVGASHPSVAMSANFTNAIFAQNGEVLLSIMINSRCVKLIDDLLYIKQNSDGGKYIEYIKNEITGQKQEKWGHASDALRYLLTMNFTREYGEFQTGIKAFSNFKVGGSLHKYSKNSY